MKKTIKHRLLALLAGFLVAFLLLEGSLIAIHIFQSQAEKSESEGIEDFTGYKILCLGNSFTIGMGANKGESYPDHLQRLFSDSFPNIPVKVINKGVSSINSAQQLHRLNGMLDSYQPDLVILQTGQPNWWNRARFGDYLDRQAGNNEAERVSSWIYDVLYHLRTFRLAIMLFKQSTAKSRLHLKYDGKIDKEAVRRKYAEGVLKECPPDPILRAITFRNSYFLNLLESENEALKADLLKRVNDIAACLERKIKKYPDHPINYITLATIEFYYKKNPARGIDLYIKGIEMNPHYFDDLLASESDMGADAKFGGYHYLRLAKKRVDNPDLIKKIDAFIDRLSHVSPEHGARLRELAEDEYVNWVSSDVREMVKIIRQHNVALIMQNYPPLVNWTFTEGEKVINGLLKDLAVSLDVPFVDQEMRFAVLLKTHSLPEYYAENGTDQHLNGVGYKKMAEHIFELFLSLVQTGQVDFHK